MAQEIHRDDKVSRLHTIDPTLWDQHLEGSGFSAQEIATLRVVAATAKFAEFPISSVLKMVISPQPIED